MCNAVEAASNNIRPNEIKLGCWFFICVLSLFQVSTAHFGASDKSRQVCKLACAGVGPTLTVPSITFEASLSSPLCPKVESRHKNVKANIMATSILFHSDCFFYKRFRTVVSESFVSSALGSCPAILRHVSASVDLELQYMVCVLTPWSCLSCEAKGLSASQIFWILWSAKFRYPVRKNPTTCPPFKPYLLTYLLHGAESFLTSWLACS